MTNGSTWVKGIFLVAIIGSPVLQCAFSAERNRSRPATAASPVQPLVVEQVRGNVYLIAGAGGNITVQIGEQGPLVVDTGLASRSADVLAAIGKLTDKPLRYIINTHYHPDHTGGNAALAKAGIYIINSQISADPDAPAPIIAHENVASRLGNPTAGQPALPAGSIPGQTFFIKSQKMFFNGEAVQIFHVPGAHTDGDSIVFFRRSDVISAGDLLNTRQYPVIDVTAGGHIDGIIEGLNTILDLTVPENNEEGGTLVVSGHGRVVDENELVTARDVLTIIRDRVKDMVAKGMTLAQVQAARPTFEYDARYGTANGDWTTEKFVAAIYQNLATQQNAGVK